MPYPYRRRPTTSRRPYRRPAARRPYKKRWSKRKMYNKASKMIFRAPGVLPDRMFTKLTYTFPGISGASPLLVNSFRGNSLYDPDASVGGAQPMGFDQLMTLYQRYRVNASSVKLTAVNNTAACGVRAVLVPSQDSGLATYQRLAESQYSKRALMANGNGQSRSFLKHYASTRKIYGIKDSSEQEYSGTATTNPTNQWYWYTVFEAADGFTILDLQFDLTITYYVEFWNRVSLQTS